MPAAAGIANLRIGSYVMTFGTSSPLDLGIVDNVDPSALKLQTVDIQAGSFGPTVLGKWIVGMEAGAAVKGQLREFDQPKIRKLLPWAPVSGSMPLMPATDNVDAYTYADKLVLHPNWLPAATTDLDITLLKAFPRFMPAALEGTNAKAAHGVEFDIFPDRSVLVTAVTGAIVKSYGYIGPPPS